MKKQENKSVFDKKKEKTGKEKEKKWLIKKSFLISSLYYLYLIRKNFEQA